MEDIIHLLPDSVANQIAAGEVIQQPSSVIKELVENSVDAGAGKIDVIIRDAGRTLIQVVDDGKGMSPTDLRLAFDRHSTSKIRYADDLFTLTTMGFRGEALASIAAIAQLDVRSMPEDAEIGSRIIINGSVVESQEPEVMVKGTNFMVRNLFFNVPARRRFLKKDSVEFANILHEFERLALVNPQVELSLLHNDQLVHSLGRSNLKTRIGELFGRNIEDNIVPIFCETDIVKITGFIGTPASTRKRGALQYFFVNGRNMKHSYFRKAILGCYEKLIAPENQPNFFVNFEIDPKKIDVNIHPTKNEIKFEEEQHIWQLLSAATKECLGKYNLGPAFDFESVSPIDIRPVIHDNIRPSAFPQSHDNTNYNPFRSDYVGNYAEISNRRQIMNREHAYESIPDNILFTDNDKNIDRLTHNFIQFDDTFILVPSVHKLLAIHQHRAHVKVLYDDFIAHMSQGNLNSQRLLFSYAITLSTAHSILLESVMDLMEESGFKLEKRTATEWELTGVPAGLSESTGVDTVKDILECLSEETFDNKEVVDRTKEIIALSMSETSAIKSGQTLNINEMEHLVNSLFRLPDAKYDPKGRIIITELSRSELDAMF